MLFALSDVVLVSVFGIIAAIVGIGGSLLTGHAAANTVRDAKREDWKRQDEMAARAERSADRIVEVNERAVVIGEHNAGQLEQVHTLVNSQMTAAKKGERDSVEVTLTLLREVAELRRASGQEPTARALATILATETKLADLNAVIVERERNDETARAQAVAQTEAGKAAATQAAAADQQHAAAQLQAEAADKQILVAEGQAKVADAQANVADKQAAATTDHPPPP